MVSATFYSAKPMLYYYCQNDQMFRNELKGKQVLSTNIWLCFCFQKSENLLYIPNLVSDIAYFLITASSMPEILKKRLM